MIKKKIKSIKASDLFINILTHEGVEYIFGIPGEENLDLLESIRQSKINFIVTRHEQAAGFMAATYGRLTGKVGVSLTTLGPGATNIATAAAYAQLGAMPMLIITGQKPIKSSKQGQFQIIDVVDMMRPLTKYTHQIVDEKNIAFRMREAIRLAQEERPGAVHLELPEDIASEQVANEFLTASFALRPSANDASILRAVEVIERAKYPLIVIGAGANRNRISRVLKDFIEKFQISFVTTQMGKGVVDERNPLYLGTAALSDHDFLHRAIDKADLIINIGHDVVEKPPFFMRHGDSMQVIHINFKSASVDPVYFPQVEVIGDIADSLTQIKRKLTKKKHWDFAYFNKIRKAFEAHLKEAVNDDAFPIMPQRLVNDVRLAVADDGIIALDNGMYKIWFARNYEAYCSNTVLLDNALATMGAGLPSAMAAKIVYPKRQVVAICGDGGFMMNAQELETAVRLNLDLVIIILRDNAYGMIEWKQNADGFKKFGLRFGNPDFIKFAQAHGVQGCRIQTAVDFLPTLKRCLGQKGIHIIEVPIDYSKSNEVLTKQLPRMTKKL